MQPGKVVSPPRAKVLIPPPENPQAQAVNTIGFLYSAERQAGLSVQTSILTTWIGCATYFIAAASVLAAMTTKESQGKIGPLIWLGAIPLVAFALAAYHLVFFAVTWAHAKSIGILEEQLVSFASIPVQVARNDIGAKAETSMTDLKLKHGAPWFMWILSFFAYGTPYFSALALTIFCGNKVWAYKETSPVWTWLILFLSVLCVLLIGAAGIGLIVKILRPGAPPQNRPATPS